MKRDVEAFKALLWRWFAAERYRETWEGGAFNSERAARREAAADKAKRALAAVLEVFEADTEPMNRGMPDHGRNLTAAEIKACDVLPQNSRDSDFP